MRGNCIDIIFFSAHVSAQEDDRRIKVASVDQQTKRALARALKTELQIYVDKDMGRLSDQSSHILVNSVVITDAGEVVVDLGKGFLPPTPSRIEQDRRDQFGQMYMEVIDPILSVDFQNAPVDFTFDGKSMDEVQPPDPTLKPKKKLTQR